MLDLRRIQYFVTLYQEGSMTGAARRLKLVQPALSMQIRRLETQFDAKLFERSSRGVEPTPIGRSFYRLCLPILEGVQGAEHYLRDASGKVAGKLTIGLMPSLAASVLAPVLLQYNDRYPDVRLHVLEGYSGTLTEWLMAGTLDFAIVNKEGPLSGVASAPLFRDSLAVIASRQMLRRMDKGFPAKRLPELKLVLPSRRQGMRRLLDAVLREAGVTIEPQIELDSLGATLELVRQSDWATILPIIAAERALAAKEVRALTIVEPQISREVVVAYHAQRRAGAAEKFMIELLQRHLQQLLAGTLA